MGTPNNLLRDLVYVNPGQASVSFGNGMSIGGQLVANNSGIVNTVTGTMANGYALTGSSGNANWYSCCVLMSPPVVDDTPYRVKLWYFGENTNGYFYTGYAPLAPTGTNDAITKVQGIPFSHQGSMEKGYFDEAVLMPSIPKTDPDYGKPIAFGLAVAVSTGNPVHAFYMSVQNMEKTAPQFATSMS